MKTAIESLKQVGTIAQVDGPVVDITCTVLPALHQALVSKLDHETYTFEVHQHLDEAHARAITSTGQRDYAGACRSLTPAHRSMSLCHRSASGVCSICLASH